MNWSARVSRLRGSRYFADIVRLATGTALAQVIGVLVTPVITRLYQPENYGLAASYLAIVAIIAPVSALRYDFAIVLPDDDVDAVAAVWLSFILTTIVTLLTAVFLLVGGSLLAGQQLGALIYLLPVSVFAAGMLGILTGWANRKQQYALLARGRIVAAVVAPVISIGGVFLVGPQPAALVLAMLAGVGANALYLYLAIGQQESLSGIRLVSHDDLRRVMREYRQFPMYNLWLTLFDQFTYSLPVLVFTSLFSPGAAAHFALANSILRLPGSLIGQSVAQVFYERAARRKESPVALRRFVVGNIRGLALLIAAPTIVTMLLGPQLFALVFGASWAEAGLYARFLMIAIALTFVTSPISLAPTVLNQQHVHLALAMLTFAARLITIFVGAQSGSSVLTVALFSLGEAITLVIFLGWLLFYLRRLEQRSVVRVG